MLEDLRGYVQVATGLTEVTTAKARQIVSSLLTQGFALSTKGPELIGQVQHMADDLLSTGRDNREVLIGLIRTEVDRTVGRMGFVREDELAALRRQVQRLEEALRTLESESKGADRPAQTVPAAGKAGEAAVDSDAPKPRKKKVLVDPQEQS